MKAQASRILTDTNVWVDFLRSSNPVMRDMLREDRVVTHSCVIGELFVGSLSRRALMLDFLQRLPKADEAEPPEALSLIENNHLWGIGLQWNDVLILASAKISGVKLWTLDQRLATAAETHGVRWEA